MAGLMDFIKTPEGQGLLSAAFAGMAGAQRGTPWNNAGRAGVAGLMGYTGTIDRQQAEEKNALYNEQARLQLDELKRKNTDAQRTRDILKEVYGQQGLPQSPKPQESGYGLTDRAPVAFDQKMPALSPQVPAKASQYESYKGVADKLAAAGLVDHAQQYYGMAEKFRPKYSTSPQKMMVGGKLANVLVSEDGSVKTLDGYDVPPEMVSTDLGGRVVWNDKNAIQPGQAFGKTMTPGESANYGLSKEKFTYQKGNDIADMGGVNQVSLSKQYGKAPPGYRWKQNGDVEPITGGPVDLKAGEAGARADQKKQFLSEQAKSVIDTVKEAKGLTGYTTAGIGGFAKTAPMTDARSLAGKIETIKANLGFDRLQQMRDMSPTGGALGQVAVQELAALQSTVASLDQLQSPGDLRKALDKVEKHYKRWEETLASKPQSQTHLGGYDADKERRYQEWKARQVK